MRHFPEEGKALFPVLLGCSQMPDWKLVAGCLGAYEICMPDSPLRPEALEP